MKTFLRLTALFSVLTLLVGCGNDDPPNPGPGPNPGGGTHEDAAANAWIYEKMVHYYLYNSKAKQMTPDYNQSCESFFTSLLSSDAQDNDGKHSGDNNYFYSYMERLEGSKTRLEVGGPSSTYGIEYIVDVYPRPTPTNYGARVLYVAKGSVAEVAGVKRGDWIRKIGNANLDLDNYSQLNSGNGLTISVAKQNGDWNWYDQRNITLPAATAVEINPILLDTVYDKGANQIAYFVYNGFEHGNNNKYDLEMREMFKRFKAKGTTDLVVDLRYNPGGYISCCRLMTSMIIPRGNLGDVFIKYKYNTETTGESGYPDMEAFMNTGEIGTNESLGLNKVYVLTGYWTASASELVINTLNPYIDVVQIGATTEGKNVGSVNYQSTYHGISLQPIVTQLYNSNGESNYKNGFTPPGGSTDELNDYTNMQPLGEDDEYLLAMTLAEITGGPRAHMTKASVPAGRFIPTRISSLNNRPVHGAIIELPEEE